MIKFLEKINFYNFYILLIFVSCFILVTNKVIVVYKDIGEDIIIDDILHNNNLRVSKNRSNYIGVLEIPRINLKKGLVDINSKYNNIDNNIQILSNDISNIETETIILAAHSGSGYKAFFKDLDKLKLGDRASVYCNEKKYDYVVSKIYTEVKDGDIEIFDSSDLLVLTTCYGKDRQLIIILEKDYDFVS